MRVGDFSLLSDFTFLWQNGSLNTNLAVSVADYAVQVLSVAEWIF